MTTVVVYNNDVQGALRILKKDQQKEGTFKAVKNKKYHKSNATKRKEKLSVIVLRKMREHKEKIAKLQMNSEKILTMRPFIFRYKDKTLKLFVNGVIKLYERSTFIRNLSIEDLDKLD